jgi:hypothetical protein
MLQASKLRKVAWLTIDSDICQFLPDCYGAVAIDLFSYGGTTYLTILDLDSDFVTLLPVASKEGYEILQVLERKS